MVLLEVCHSYINITELERHVGAERDEMVQGDLLPVDEGRLIGL